jgi:gamma-glutamyl-gamma-aminobutyrate hydrolase PuuD
VSSSSKKILMVNDLRLSYAPPFKYLQKEFTSDPKELFRDPESIALVVFTGGADVSPSLYEEKPHWTTGSNLTRDIQEKKIFEDAKAAKIPFVGICRGAQFLCVMAGGRLVQDITGHAGGRHEICFNLPNGSQEVVEVTSSHHQMQYPFSLQQGEDYLVIANSAKRRSKHYAFNSERVVLANDLASDDPLLGEPDVILYPKIKALAAQYHPEWMSEKSRGFTIFQELVSHYLGEYINGEADTQGKAIGQAVS